jgi:hypothetical protein
MTVRKRYRVFTLAALSAALAVPLGFALSLDSDSAVDATPPVAAVVMTSAVAAAPPLLVPPNSGPLPFAPVYGGAKLLFVGAALFGLANVLRRS